jgi:hypothetical protein
MGFEIILSKVAFKGEVEGGKENLQASRRVELVVRFGRAFVSYLGLASRSISNSNSSSRTEQQQCLGALALILASIKQWAQYC